MSMFFLFKMQRRFPAASLCALNDVGIGYGVKNSVLFAALCTLSIQPDSYLLENMRQLVCEQYQHLSFSIGGSFDVTVLVAECDAFVAFPIPPVVF